MIFCVFKTEVAAVLDFRSSEILVLVFITMQNIGGATPKSFGGPNLRSVVDRRYTSEILRLAVLIQYRRVTDTHTHTDRHTAAARTALA